MLARSQRLCVSFGVDVIAAIRLETRRHMGKLDRHPVFKPIRGEKRKWTMPVVLRQDLEELGREGDVVFVKRDYGRNQLIPNGLAYYGTEENILKYGILDRPKRERSVINPRLVETLKKLQLDFQRPKGKQWVIDEHHIAENFISHDIWVPVHCISFADEQPITDFGEFETIVTINGTLDIPVSVAVTEWIPRMIESWTEFFAEEEGGIDESRFQGILDTLDDSDGET